MSGCVVIQDRFGDIHSHETHGEANPEQIRKLAGYLAHNVAVTDPGEYIRVGLSRRNDPGAARLDLEIYWLYEIDADEIPQDS